MGFLCDHYAPSRGLRQIRFTTRIDGAFRALRLTGCRCCEMRGPEASRKFPATPAGTLSAAHRRPRTAACAISRIAAPDPAALWRAGCKRRGGDACRLAHPLPLAGENCPGDILRYLHHPHCMVVAAQVRRFRRCRNRPPYAQHLLHRRRHGGRDCRLDSAAVPTGHARRSRACSA